MTNRYISDLHFYHNNIIGFDKRPFSSVEEMNETLIKNWNSVVQPGDMTYIIGDFCWLTNKDIWRNLLCHLNGQKTLIKGNHDITPSGKLRKLFADVKERKEIKDNGRTVIMNHFPELLYKHSYDPKTFMLCGHVHTTKEDQWLEIWRSQIRNAYSEAPDNFGQIINVGCMKPYMDYTPRTLDELIEKTVI